MMRGSFDVSFMEPTLSSQMPFLFPNLRVLTWSVAPSGSESRRNSDLAVITRQLFSDTIVSLSVTFHEADPGIHSFLQNFVSLCSRLKSFTLYIHQDLCKLESVSRSDIHQLSLAIGTHEHLEHLHILIPIEDAALTHIMLSPRNKYVSLPLYPGVSNLGDLRITSANTPFRNIRKLALHVWDLRSVCSLLRPNKQRFHTFCLNLRAHHKAETVSALFTALASPHRMNSLYSIHLTAFVDYTTSDRLTYDVLHPLTSLKHLRELELSLPTHTFLNDNELANLTHNWPMLEVLVLDCSAMFYRPFVSSITLRGLLSLLSNCPQLRKVELPLDAREIPGETDVDVRSTTLTSFALADCDSPILYPRLVANFFSRYLPSVKYIFPTTEPRVLRHNYIQLWNTVNHYL